VVYPRDARRLLLDITDETMKGLCSSSERQPGAPALCNGLGPVGDRRGGADRQPLWRRGES